jgi:hypothetical protein
LYKKFENLGCALQYAYPEIEWDLKRFSFRGKKSGQRWLKFLIEELVPGIQIYEDYRHPAIKWGALSHSSLFFYVSLCREIEEANGSGSLAAKAQHWY